VFGFKFVTYTWWVFVNVGISYSISREVLVTPNFTILVTFPTLVHVINSIVELIEVVAIF